MKFKQTGMLIFGALLFNACTGQPSIQKIDEVEVGKYEKIYKSNYEKIKHQNVNYKPSSKWIQPKNKKEECKVYVSINPKDDKTLKSDYSLYWDGKCKDGFAYGLGREIEEAMFSNIEQLGYYDKGKAVDYCVMNDSLNGITVDGECSYDHKKPNHTVRTQINEKNGNLQISYAFGVSGTFNSPQMITKTYPFHDVVEYFKAYPNYSYYISDFTKNEFDNRKYEFQIREHKNGKFNGFGFASFKRGYTNSGEMINGNLVRRVQLPQSYFNNANSIHSEIKRASNIALEAQRKALIIKEKYKKKICKDNVKVDFMENNEYKSICNENKKYADLKIKIDAKLAQIEQKKQLKRENNNQQRLVQARESEAASSHRRAAAAEQANSQASWDSLNRSIQNSNSNMQMQQLNNNLMMYNTTPKRYDVYIH